MYYIDNYFPVLYCLKMIRIGQIAKRTGVSQRTIRYYEEMGLISHPTRTQGGFRLYPEEMANNIKLIQSLKDTGFLFQILSPC